MRFTSNHGPRNFYDAANTWKEKPNFNWARSQTFTSPQSGSISINSSSYQMKLEKALLDFDSNQEKRKLASKSITAISHDEREELRKNGIKSQSNLLSLKYLSPASIKELNRNPSALKHVHFVNSIVILSTDSDTEEEDAPSINARELDLDSTWKGKEEVKEQGMEEDEMETDMEVDEVIEKEESEFETDEEIEEILKAEEDDEDGENFNSFPTMEELTHHEWILKNPRPP
ncbi:hypothetical protein Tco_0349072 [Tanacetum coccineum]